jgi:tight adherence protein B
VIGVNLPILRAGVCALCFALALLVLFVVLREPESLPLRLYSRYVARLDRMLYNMLLPTCGRWIVVGQALVLEIIGIACIGFGAAWHFVALLPAVVGPLLYLERMRVRRIVAIEAQVDGFLLSLANSLRTTPSIGLALSYSEELTSDPLRSELARALHELRLGSSVDQALLSLGARVRSATLDAALLSVLIGRQVGGDLTKVLETTAATLREATRLQGVLRTKTAESKAQMLVMALFPVFVVYGFSRAVPGFFDPLLVSATGHMLIAVACVLWLASIIVAYRLLSVAL